MPGIKGYVYSIRRSILKEKLRMKVKEYEGIIKTF
jgi:hypothetical protein